MKELSLCVTMKLDLLLYFLHWVIVWLRRFKLYLIDILLRGRCSLPWPAGGSSGDMLPGDCGWLPLEERFKSETVYKRIYHHQVDLIFSYTRTNVRVNHLIFPIHRLPTLDQRWVEDWYASCKAYFREGNTKEYITSVLISPISRIQGWMQVGPLSGDIPFCWGGCFYILSVYWKLYHMRQVQKSWKRATVDKFGMYTPESNGIEAEDKLQRSIRSIWR